MSEVETDEAEEVVETGEETGVEAEQSAEETGGDPESGAEEPEAGEGGEQQAEPSEAEQLARQRGWKSRDEWAGTVPKSFIDDPERFNEVYERKAEVTSLRKKVEEQGAAIESVKKWREAERARMKKEAQAEAELLIEQARQAYADGDAEKGDRLLKRRDERLDVTREPEPAEEQDAGDGGEAGPPPEFQAFVERNPWYEWSPTRGYRDPERAEYANNYAADLKDRGVAPKDRYDLVAKAVEEKFGPYGKPNGSGAPRGQSLNGDGGGAGARSGAGKKKLSFSSLDPETQMEARSAIKQGLYKSEADFLKTYTEEYGS